MPNKNGGSGRSGSEWRQEAKFVLQSLERIERKVDTISDQQSKDIRFRTELHGRVEVLEKSSGVNAAQSQQISTNSKDIATMQTKMMIYTALAVFVLTAVFKYAVPLVFGGS